MAHPGPSLSVSPLWKPCPKPAQASSTDAGVQTPSHLPSTCQGQEMEQDISTEVVGFLTKDIYDPDALAPCTQQSLAIEGPSTASLPARATDLENHYKRASRPQEEVLHELEDFISGKSPEDGHPRMKPMDKAFACSLNSDLRETRAESGIKKHTILLFPQEEAVNAYSVLKKKADPVKEGLSISTVRPLRNKGVAVDCHTKEDAQKLLSKIKQHTKLAEALDSKRPEPRFPRCVVYDIPYNTEYKEILDALAMVSVSESVRDLCNARSHQKSGGSFYLTGKRTMSKNISMSDAALSVNALATSNRTANTKSMCPLWDGPPYLLLQNQPPRVHQLPRV
ncbi:hypothetical protein AVEN_64695-1 [Araneus ventricosus]|uniref:Uncharacterized protein n=1 Tax=Araneus ventricosus TaxID=182803 RepID=A0A4Y2Q8B6_ARAVE|nr:hypothetical protein AVEN_64695-1 [Araneus ventricosus]